MKKLVIIGCGLIGEYHLGHFVQFDDIELAGFCDKEIEKAQNFVNIAKSGKAYTNFIEMYNEVEPDMVFICVPPTQHGAIEFETIKRNIPFFVEKPLSLDLKMAKDILAQIEEKGLIAASGFQCRYDDINVAAKEYIANNEILHINASRVGGIPDASWWNVKFTSGGQLVEQTVHQMDMLRYLLGSEPDTVYSVASRGYITQEENAGYYTDDLSTTIITFKNGTTCTMMTGCYSTNGASWDSKMTFGSRSSRMDYVLCSRATTYGVEEDKAEEIAGTIKGDGTQRRNENEVGVTVRNSNDFGVECDRTFIDAVISGDPSKIRSPYSDALKSVAFVLACNESMATGLPVKVVY